MNLRTIFLQFHTRRTLQILILISLLIYVPVMLRVVPESDFLIHFKFAEDFRAFKNDSHISYPLYHYSINLVTNLLNPDTAEEGIVIAYYSGFAIAILMQIATAIITLILIYRAAPIFINRRIAVIYSLTALGLVTIAPITLFHLNAQDMQAGYSYPTFYHNPTIIMLKPFAIILFILSVRVFEEQTPSNMFIIGTAAISIATVMAKPSYTIALLPGLSLVALYTWFRKKTVHWKLLIFGIIIPNIPLLLTQFLFTFARGESSLDFRPFFIAIRLSGDTFMIIATFLLSILFPLAVAVLYRKRAIRDTSIILSWVIFFIGSVYFYLLVEDGPQLYHRNFQWTTSITVFIVFLAHALFFIKHRAEAMSKSGTNLKDRIIIVIFILHSLNGVYWYLAHLLADKFYLIF